MENRQISGLNASVLSRFRALKQQFIAGLGDRWLEIESSRSDADALKGALHRLAGSAGSYELPSLGVLARQAELLVSQGASAELDQALTAVYQGIQNAQSGAIDG